MGDELADVLRTDVPHSARVWNYWLGGKDNYPADQAAGDAVLETYPDIATVARQSRAFLRRAVRLLAGELGIDQFLDVGTGLPTMQNTHEVAQAIVPDARVVYVDNDPLVLAHARALLTDTTPNGVTAYVDADVRDPELIVADARNVLNFERPIAVMFLGILGYVPDLDEARTIVRRIMSAVPSGSYLLLRDNTDLDAAARDAADDYAESGVDPYHLRAVDELLSFFDGLELVEPGLVRVAMWRPGQADIGAEQPTTDHAGLARKP
jgi:hypothetical protein